VSAYGPATVKGSVHAGDAQVHAKAGPFDVQAQMRLAAVT
jgi:hypothetical protein